ncbi:MAG: nitroreductase family protein [Deltaproteobacteria bacterium]|nr:nitroreductase family protein [Deltaproteobacteria bacterium]
MDVFEAMRERRSVRRYADRPVEDTTLERVLEAARQAPSWANTQCWRFVVVRDPQTKQRIAEATPEGNPGRKALAQAPVVICACAQTGVSGFFNGKASTALGDWFLFDLGLAMSQLTLAAHALGLGTVHVGLIDTVKVGELLGLPADVKFVEAVPLGYPEKPSKPTPRKSPAELVKQERWS